MALQLLLVLTYSSVRFNYGSRLALDPASEPNFASLINGPGMQWLLLSDDVTQLVNSHELSQFYLLHRCITRLLKNFGNAVPFERQSTYFGLQFLRAIETSENKKSLDVVNLLEKQRSLWINNLRGTRDLA